MSRRVCSPDGDHEHPVMGEHAHPRSLTADDDVVAEELPSRPPQALGDAEEEVVEGEF